jgi:hypothetical protein
MLRNDVPRARRYPVTFAIEYRQGRHHEWRTGLTQNVSASGVLFTEPSADRPLDTEAPIDMRLVIPSNVTGQPSTCILCSGRVARISAAGANEGRRTVAATIRRYRLRRADLVDRPTAAEKDQIN